MLDSSILDPRMMQGAVPAQFMPPPQGPGGMLSGAVPTAPQSAPLPMPMQEGRSAAPAPMPSQSPIPDTSLLGRIGAAFNGGLLGGGASTGLPQGGANPSFLDRLHNNSLMLMALGSGMMGAPTFATGLSRGMQAAIPAIQEQQKLAYQNYQIGMQQQSMKATYDALTKMGALPQEAMAAALGNQDIMKAVSARYIEPQGQIVKTGSGPFGDIYSEYNARSHTLTPVNRLASGGGAGAQSGGASGGGGAQGWLAPGVTDLNEDLTGFDYLKQFNQNFQAAVTHYMNGESMPTGNPRTGFVQNVKAVAQRVGNDIGQPVDDTTFIARRQMRNRLSDASPNSLGGQVTTGNTALGHLADVSDAALAHDHA